MKLKIETTKDVKPKKKLEIEFSGGSPYYANILINGKMFTVFVRQTEGEDDITVEPTENSFR